MNSDQTLNAGEMRETISLRETIANAEVSGRPEQNAGDLETLSGVNLEFTICITRSFHDLFI